MCPAEEAIPDSDCGVTATVLVVEDEVLIRLALAEHLRSCGFIVIEAANGEEAQALILAGAYPDLIISDINMPGAVDGVALALWLRDQNVNAVVMLTSGMESSLSAAQTACTHVQDFVPKPYSFEVLTERARLLLANRATGA